MTNGLTMSEEDFERPQLEPKGGAYRLSEDWHTDCKGCIDNGKITIPAGFVTDGASIPRFLWPVCGDPMATPRIYAAIVHDYFYTSPHQVALATSTDPHVIWHVSRERADKLYRDYQIALGISKFKAYTEYWALRMFGGSHWEK